MNTNNDLLLNKKVFVSTVGWIGVMASSLLIYFLGLQVIKLFVLTGSDLYKEFFGDETSEVYQDFFDIYIIMIIVFIAIIGFSIFFLTSSIGLLKYKNWGRLSFISISFGFIIISISTILMYLFYQSDALRIMAGQAFNSEMDGVIWKIFAIQIASYGILLVVINRMLFRIIRRFRSDDYRILFKK